MSAEYAGKIVLVTGGASGIGLALVGRLARAGATVYAADLSAERLDVALAPLLAEGRAVRPVVLDVTDAAAFERVVAELHAREGRLDVLFNNAGVGVAGEVRDLGLEDWRRMVDVNVYGVVHGIAAVYPRMIAQGHGQIVNTASGAGLGPRPGQTPYAAAKHAVIGLSTSLRAEARAYGVRVTAACPGYVATHVMRDAKFVGVDREKLAARIPIRPMSADRCAELMLRGAARDQAIVAISAYVKLDWWVYRLSPALSCWLAEWRARQVRASKP